jgi:methyl-accepting chemotaxis protein
MSLLPNLSLRRLAGRIFWTLIFLAALMLLAGIASSLVLSSAARSSETETLRLKQVAALQVLSARNESNSANLNLMILYRLNNVGSLIAENQRNLVPMLADMNQYFTGTDQATLAFNGIKAAYARLSSEVQSAQAFTLNPEDEIGLYRDIKLGVDQVGIDIGKLLQDRQVAAEAAHADRVTLTERTRWSYLLVGLLLFILAILFAVIIARLVAIPFALLAGRLQRISHGDLTEQILPQGHRGIDEITELSSIFNRTIANLKLAISRIQEQVKTINQVSQKISLSSDRQTGSLTQQALAVAQVTATTAELSNTSENIAGAATQLAESADAALVSANEGYLTLQGTAETMSDIRQKVNLIADRILALNSVAQRIREITLLIDTLSNETHLLALNAAIESAGAGEEGMRFGVVAGHVRKLSQRSRVAAIEIQQLVSQIQNAAASSVMATEEGIKVVALGDKMVSDSLRANENIIRQIEQTSQLAQGISQATEQQRQANTQVAVTMHELSQISHNIRDNSRQYLASTTDLEEVIRQLNGIVNAFTLEDTPENARQLSLTPPGLGPSGDNQPLEGQWSPGPVSV